MLIDVPGLALGHASLTDTGVSAVVSTSPAGMVGAVDVRGGGPGTRETDLLEPHNTVERVHAIVLAGGSAFGLAAADGAMVELERRGYGFPVFGEDNPGPRVPIVPAAVIFDLIVGDPNHRPSAADGAAAIRDALEGTTLDGAVAAGPTSGSVGAGCGATAGVLRGGFGQASQQVDQYVVAAAVVANPVGAVIDPATGRFFGGGDHPDATRRVDLEKFNNLERPTPKLNTTIGVVATNAPLAPAQLKRLAMTGHDGIARAVRPAHSPLDGDTLFAVSTATPEEFFTQSRPQTDVDPVELMAQLSAASAACVEAAIVDAVASAESTADSPELGITAWRDIAL
ncbi:P1 family peptidase [Corynebacterium aquatimens]|nr:P1 family peptidase [Corynebacterium aquatimens]WJY65221.1 Peptidase family S58 [Corynebacterium aquatimens]